MILGDFVHEYKFDNYEQLNEPVIEYLYKLRDSEEKSDRLSNRGGWQKNHLEKYPELSELSSAIFKEFHNFVVTHLDPVQKLSIYLGNMFANVNPPGAYHLPHVHDCHWTGVYYLQGDEDSGSLCIQKPHQGPSQAEQTKFFANIRLEHKFDPVPGTGYFFPSHLVHYVEENLSTRDRISVAYNIKITEQNDMQNS
ncbi:MAG: hypothetical protein CL961_07070 [Euryarchaeota archaeon]|mgnify:FL=1|nr:hypothetical protein [Euryarchaeota archaeon]|tara:strand:+ start:5659 stop:6246 length:588 start_codon:yes stop_codon:yes gene_type:complete